MYLDNELTQHFMQTCRKKRVQFDEQYDKPDLNGEFLVVNISNQS